LPRILNSLKFLNYLIQTHSNIILMHLHLSLSLCRHKKQKEEDIAICECRYDEDDPDSACGDGCLNVLTSTECTPGFCPCGILCKNQVSPCLGLYVMIFVTLSYYNHPAGSWKVGQEKLLVITICFNLVSEGTCHNLVHIFFFRG